jgi:PKD repeat protein
MKRFFIYVLLTSIAIACHIETPQKPVSKFTFTPANGCKAPCVVTFKSSAENAASIQWDFGDGSEWASGDSAQHLFLIAKTYEVKMIVKGVDGGSSGFTQTVKIEARSAEAFSMSGDRNFPTDIIADEKGNVYISGTGRGNIDFGNTITRNLSLGSDDFFVAKYDSTGKCLWVYTDGSAGDDHANALAIDHSTNRVYVTGFIGGALADGSKPARGNFDGFVAMLNGTSGNRLWITTFGGPLNDQGRSLAFYQAATGKKIYLTGTVEGDNVNRNIEFGDYRKSANNRDGFLMLLNATDGICEEPVMITGPNIQAPEAIAVDESGNAYITGAFLKTIEFPSTSLVGLDSVDVFVAKWDYIEKRFQWARRAASTRVDFAYDIILDSNSQNVFVTGMHNGYLGELKLNSNNDENVYLGKWDANGNVRNARNGFSEGNQDYHGGIALAANGDIIIAGSFYGKGWFPMKSDPSAKSKGSTDIIITKVDPQNLNPTIDTPITDGGADEDRVNKICVVNGYVYATGWFYGTSTYNGVTLNGGSYPIPNTFVARYKL